MFKNLFSKDGLIGVVFSFILGLMGMGAFFGLDLTTLGYGILGTFIGSMVAMWFKESRRGKSEVRPDGWYWAYIVGFVLSTIAMYFIWKYAL